MSAGALSILIYHRVLAQRDSLFPDEVDARRFARQLRLLRRHYRVLPLADAVRRLQDGSLPPRAACISFDDGYADNAEIALPLLLQHGLHATFFIATGYLNGGLMWNDRLIASVRAATSSALDLRALGLPRLPLSNLAQRRAAIATLLAQLKYLPFARREQLAADIARLAGAGAVKAPQAAMLSTAQLRQLAAAGMGIGAHTASHPILATLPDATALADIVAGRHALETLLQLPVPLFAYPNGKYGHDYDARHLAMVRQLGFTAALSTDAGVARTGAAGAALYRLPRFTPWRPGYLGFLWQLRQNRRAQQGHYDR